MTTAALGYLLAVALPLQDATAPQTATPPQTPPQERQFVPPAEPIILPGMPQIQAGNDWYWVLPNGNIGPKVVANRTWPGLFAAPTPADPTTKSRVRIMVVRELGQLGQDYTGQTMSRRSTITSFNDGQIEDATKLFQLAISHLSVGAAEVEVDLQNESELLIFQNVPFTPQDEAGQRINDWLYNNVVTPKNNVAPFDSEDPTDYGPFDLVVVVHPGLTETVTTYSKLGRNVLIVPLFSAETNVTANLANQMTAAWIASRSDTWSLQGRRTGDSNTVLLAKPDADSLVTSAPNANNFQPAQAGTNGETPYTGTATGDSPVEWLGYTPTQPTVNAQATGNYSVSQEGDVTTISQKGGLPVGYVKLLTEPTQLTNLKITASINGEYNDRFALHLLDSNGEILKIVQVSGSPTIDYPNVERAMVPLNGEWQDFTAVVRDLPRPVAEIRLTPFPESGKIRQVSNGFIDLQIRNFQVAEAADGETSVVSALPTPLEAFEAEFQDVPETLPANRWPSLRDAVESPNPELKAAVAKLLTRTKITEPEAISALKTLARSSYEEIVPVAAQALAFQDTPESWAALRETLEKGPFIANHKAAWEQLKDRPKDESWTRIATVLSTQNSWGLRRIAIELHSQINEEPSQVAVLTGFQDYEPAVRLAAAQNLDPDQEFFARRLIFVAVNDSSEAVRSACLIRLLDSDIERLRTEAHRGVRDESIAVRLALLDAVRQRQSPEDRPVLQLAMTDQNPLVLSAALEAFAAQPGDVASGEVQTAFSTTDVRVARALIKLAIAKEIGIPGEDQARFRAMGDAEINRLIDQIKPVS